MVILLLLNTNGIPCSIKTCHKGERIMRRRIILLILLIVLIAATSCSLDLSLSNEYITSLYGEWETTITYTGFSDSLYDYASSSLLVIKEDRTMYKKTNYYLKLRTEQDWTPNLNHYFDTTSSFYLRIYSFDSEEGYMELYNPDTLAFISRLDYSLSQYKNTLILRDDKSIEVYTRVQK